MIEIICGVLVGIIIASLFRWNPWTTTGTLRIDHSNPKKDLYRFEINNLDNLKNKKRVVLRIDHHADLSQK